MRPQSAVVHCAVSCVRWRVEMACRRVSGRATLYMARVCRGRTRAPAQRRYMRAVSSPERRLRLSANAIERVDAPRNVIKGP